MAAVILLVATLIAPLVGARDASAASRVITPEQFGARGNGVADDTRALQQAFDRASRGVAVVLKAGHVYRHSQVLLLRRPGMRLTGAGVLQATDPERSSVWIEADNVLVDGGVIVRAAKTNVRWAAWEQMGVRLFGHRGITLRNVTVDGAAAAGVYVGNQSSRFVLDHVTVLNTHADGIHLTMGSNNGRVIAPTIRNSGDDGVAVVSYLRDGTPCHDITITSPRVLGTSGGRGLSVVGGVRIRETNIDVRNSSAAGLYIAAESGPWFTAAPQNVTVLGGSISGANTDHTIDHGAVLVVSEEAGPTPRNILVSGLRISGTRASATRNAGVITYGRPPSNVVLTGFTITGGPRLAYEGNTPRSSFRLSAWTQNGTKLPNG